jgi:hypothetical protein
MFALLSVIECPGCGEMMPFGAMNPFGEPDLTVMKCPKYGLDIQARHDKGENLVVEPLKKH